MRRRVAGCPSFCRTDHHAIEDVEGLRQHDSEALCVASVSGMEHGASVSVIVCDDLEAGTRGVPVVDVATDDGFSPAQARQLAFALLEAAELAEMSAVAR
jgi:hypothetical protein